jgi:aspartate/methionine/tyrosine aminotransferase
MGTHTYDLETSLCHLNSAHRLGYTESSGHPTLKAEIAKLYNTITPNDVLVRYLFVRLGCVSFCSSLIVIKVCAGAEESIFLFMNALLTAGDHVIVHTPCYQSLSEIARSIGCHITQWIAKV